MALPMAQQILLDIVAPPILAVIWWLKSRSWAQTVQGENVSERTKARQKKEFWILLAVVYLLMFGTTFYALLRR